MLATQASLRFRVRVITGILSVMALIAGSFVVTYLELGAPLLAGLVALGCATCVALVVRVQRGGDPDRIAHLAVFVIAGLLTADNLHTGGFFDPNFSWLYVVPVTAALLIGVRAAIVWTLIMLGVTVAFFFDAELGLPVTDLIDPAAHPAQSLFNRLTTLVALGAMATLFVLERNRTHRSLEVALRRAEAATETSHVFLATMSHELRTPLNAILGYSELLREQVEAGEQGDLDSDLARIEGAGRHLLDLVDDVLSLSRIDAGELVLHIEPVDLGPLLDDVAATARPLLDANGNTLTVHCTPPCTVAADPFRLRQVLLNLLGNAAKFTENGQVTLTVQADATTVTVVVQDTGIGMPAEALDRVFERFQQVDTSPTRRFGGTGLGLAIARELVHAMHGTIGVESVHGQGSRFAVTLPRASHVTIDEAANAR